MAKSKLATATDENGNVTRSVYLNPEVTMTALVARLESTTEAGLRFMAAMVVHIVGRMHPLVDEDKRTSKEIDSEIERAITRHATGKNGKAFAHAWTARLLTTGKKIASAMEGDFNKSGYSGPVGEVLRCQSADEANDIVYNFIMTKTKGANNLTAIVKVMNPPKAGHGAAGKRSNNAKGDPVIKVRADTAPAESVAARILGETGGDVFKNLPKGKGKSEETAIRLADNVGKGNVDRRTFLMRSLALVDSPELLLEVAEFAMNRAKELQGGKRTRKPKATETGDVAMPEAAAAQAQVS